MSLKRSAPYLEGHAKVIAALIDSRGHELPRDSREDFCAGTIDAARDYVAAIISPETAQRLLDESQQYWRNAGQIT